ncbi:CRISPR-associated endoribonuclease Cas2 [Candidatus Entotheonellaceae bacterium PAL068K]
MFYVVAYDISSDKRRLKVAKILEDFGDRAQYSVFEMQLDRADQLDELQQRLQTVIDPGSDGVRVYFLCRACREKAVVLGQGQIYRDEDVYII